MGIEFRLANKTDKASIKRFYKEQKYSAGFMGYDHTMLALVGETIVGAVIVSRIDENNSQYLLHGLVISKGYRDQKIASTLINQIKKRYAPIYCFADSSLANFYLKKRCKKVKFRRIINYFSYSAKRLPKKIPYIKYLFFVLRN